MKSFALILLLVTFSPPSQGALAPKGGFFLLPLTCAELLPDNAPYLGFLESVANGVVVSDREFSKRLYRVLALRQKLFESGTRARENNPIDILIRRTLCFYREQKEPLRPVPFDDTDFLKFLRGSLKELEYKIDDAVFQEEFEKYQRQQYENQLNKNRAVVERVKSEAETSAENAYERLSRTAKQKVNAQ